MKKSIIILVFLSLIFRSFSQEAELNTSVDHAYLEIDFKKYWKYKNGDDPAWAKPYYDDSNWDTIGIRLNLFDTTEISFTGQGWFRYELELDSNYENTPLYMYVNHMGASEIYIDGELIYNFGKGGESVTDE